MCRMFVVVNPKNLDKLLDDFALVAKGQNELYEKCENRFHDSGYGVAWLEEKEFSCEKIPLPYYNDYKNLSLKKYRSIKPKIVIVHSRKGENVCIENCHPFLYYDYPEKWVFCHNGMIFDQINFSEKFKPKGTTDSEKLFYRILSQEVNAENIKKIASELKEYSGANFILAGRDKIFVNCQFTESPFYYTMKICQEGDELIISSEVLRSKREKWLPIANKTLLEISINDGYKICQR